MPKPMSQYSAPTKHTQSLQDLMVLLGVGGHHQLIRVAPFQSWQYELVPILEVLQHFISKPLYIYILQVHQIQNIIYTQTGRRQVNIPLRKAQNYHQDSAKVQRTWSIKFKVKPDFSTKSELHMNINKLQNSKLNEKKVQGEKGSTWLQELLPEGIPLQQLTQGQNPTRYCQITTNSIQQEQKEYRPPHCRVHQLCIALHSLPTVLPMICKLAQSPFYHTCSHTIPPPISIAFEL